MSFPNCTSYYINIGLLTLDIPVVTVILSIKEVQFAMLAKPSAIHATGDMSSSVEALSLPEDSDAATANDVPSVSPSPLDREYF